MGQVTWAQRPGGHWGLVLSGRRGQGAAGSWRLVDTEARVHQGLALGGHRAQGLLGAGTRWTQRPGSARGWRLVDAEPGGRWGLVLGGHTGQGVAKGWRSVDAEARVCQGLAVGGCWKLDCSACPQVFDKSMDFFTISLINGSQ